MKKFSESLRVDYPLDSTSLVVDLGAFDGTFARNIASLYGCRVIAFEPVKSHFTEAVCNTANMPNVCMINSAVDCGGSFRSIGVRNNSSSFHNASGAYESVSIVRVVPLFTCLGRVDVLKVNIEGAEYAILDTLINAGLHLNVSNIQVQFHDNVIAWQAKYQSIKERLEKTHEQEWDSHFTWENYRLK